MRSRVISNYPLREDGPSLVEIAPAAQLDEISIESFLPVPHGDAVERQGRWRQDRICGAFGRAASLGRRDRANGCVAAGSSNNLFSKFEPGAGPRVGDVEDAVGVRPDQFANSLCQIPCVRWGADLIDDNSQFRL